MWKFENAFFSLFPQTDLFLNFLFTFLMHLCCITEMSQISYIYVTFYKLTEFYIYVQWYL